MTFYTNKYHVPYYEDRLNFLREQTGLDTEIIETLLHANSIYTDNFRVKCNGFYCVTERQYKEDFPEYQHNGTIKSGFANYTLCQEHREQECHAHGCSKISSNWAGIPQWLCACGEWFSRSPEEEEAPYPKPKFPAAFLEHIERVLVYDNYHRFIPSDLLDELEKYRAE